MQQTLIIRPETLSPNDQRKIEIQTPSFPHLGLIEPKRWKTIRSIYTARSKKGELVGICGVTQLKRYLKIGPVVILVKYQDKGLGSLLLRRVVFEHSRQRLYIGSANPKVWTIAQKLNFQQAPSFWSLPQEIKYYLIMYFLRRLSWRFVTDALKKRLSDAGPYYYFLYEPT